MNIYLLIENCLFASNKLFFQLISTLELKKKDKVKKEERIDWMCLQFE